MNNLETEAIQEADLSEKGKEEYVRHAIICGLNLIQIKDNGEHGEFTKWINTNMPIGNTQCKRYMLICSDLLSLPKSKGPREGLFNSASVAKFKQRIAAAVEGKSIRQLESDAQKKKQAEENAKANERNSIKKEKIKKLEPEAKKLRTYIRKITCNKGIDTDDTRRMNKVAMEEVIYKHGYEWCENRVDEILEEAIAEPEPQEESQYEKEKRERVEEKLNKIRAKTKRQTEKLFEKLIFTEDTRNELFNILDEAGIDLQKKVFKVMKMHLHPDRDTGNEELFKRLLKVEGEFK